MFWNAEILQLSDILLGKVDLILSLIHVQQNECRGAGKEKVGPMALGFWFSFCCKLFVDLILCLSLPNFKKNVIFWCPHINLLSRPTTWCCVVLLKQSGVPGIRVPKYLSLSSNFNSLIPPKNIVAGTVLWGARKSVFCSIRRTKEDEIIIEILMGLWYIKFKKWWFTSISFWFEVNYGTAIINGSLRQHIATALEFMWTQHVRKVLGLKKKKSTKLEFSLT